MLEWQAAIEVLMLVVELGGPAMFAHVRELTMMRRVCPSPEFGGRPVTNIRNTSSPLWRGWLRPES